MHRKRTLKQNKQHLSNWGLESIFAETEFQKHYVGQEKALAYMSGVYATYRCGLSFGQDWLAPRILCTGSMSSGKTSSIQSLAKMLGLPYAVASMANLSPSGFKGGTLTDAISELVARAGSVKRLEQRGGILHIDEICKFSSNRKTDQFYESVIFNTLGILGGEQVQVESSDGYDPSFQVNTNRILVFISGAFTGVNECGWSNEAKVISTLLRLNYPKEFVSRISGHVHFERLSKQQMREAIKNETQKMKVTFKTGNDEPIVTEKIINDVLLKTTKSGLGLRSSRLFLQNYFINSALKERYQSLT